MPKISVIIPIYNMGKYLPGCLDSVLSQRLSDIEVICVDDGSTDNSLAIARDYCEKDNRIIVISQNNKGSGAARNIAIEKASGEYLAMMDPDDYYPNDNCLMLLYEAAIENNAYIVGGNRVDVYNGKKVLFNIEPFTTRGFLDYKDVQLMYGHTRFIYKTSMIKKNGIRYAESRRFQDQIFILKSMTCAQRFYAIPECIYELRVIRTGKKFFPEETVEGMFESLKECIQYAFDNDYQKVFKKYLWSEPEAFLARYRAYPYSQNINTKIWGTLREIYSIEKKWLGKVYGEEWTPELIDSRIMDGQNEIQLMCNACSDVNSVIIYGAGYATKIAIKALENKSLNSKIEGLAQTICKNEEDVCGFRLKQIDWYAQKTKDVMIMIMVSDENARREMYHKAIDLGFDNVYVVKAEKLLFLNKMGYCAWD